MAIDPSPVSATTHHSPLTAHRFRLWPIHSLVAIFLAITIGAVFRPWLRPFHQPQRGGPDPQFRHIRAGDLTPLFSVWTQVTARSLFARHDLPLWSDHIYCGEPFFAKPQIGVLSLTTLLCAVLPAQVVATWTFLLHLWIAGMATYVWALGSLTGQLREGLAGDPTGPGSPTPATCLAAACGAVAFMLSGLMIEHTMMGHGPIVLVACWTPLVLRALVRAMTGDRPVRDACVVGVLVAVQILAGGETMFLYNVLAGGIVGLAWLLCGKRTPDGRAAAQGPATTAKLGRAAMRLAAVVGLVGLVGFGLAAIKLLPGLELMPITNRAGGLRLEDAAAPIVEFTEPSVFGAFLFGPRTLLDVRHLFAGTLGLATLGLLGAWRHREVRWLAVAGGLLVLAGVAIAHSSAVFGMLWAWLPMFKYQRIPQRALVLAYLGLSLLATLGVRCVLEVHWLRSAAGKWWAGLLLLGAVTAESIVALPALPPTADIRKEVRENHILNHLAQQPGQFRIHAIESNDRNWGIEHVTVPLGLSNLAGWDHLWLREYLGAEGTIGRDVLPFLSASYQYQHPARFWGLMNVHFVTAMQSVQVPGLRFVQKFPECPNCQPAKSAGPYLYENDDAMPRAWFVDYAILVLGDRAERMEAVHRILDDPKFDARRVVVISAEESELAHELATCMAVALPARWTKRPLVKDIKTAGTKSITYSAGTIPFWTQPAEVTSLLEFAADPSSAEGGTDGPTAAPPGPALIAEYRQNSLRVRLDWKYQYLVLGEKFAHFPGWQVRTATGPRELLKANGVASAVRLDGTEEWIELSYWPRSLTIGATISALTLLTLIGTTISALTSFVRGAVAKYQRAAVRGLRFRADR